MNSKPPLSFLAAALIGLAAQSASAAAQDKLATQDIKMIETRFTQADKNNDGKLTPDEAKAGMPMVAKYFTRIDKANTGFVTLDDIKAAMASGKMAASNGLAK